MIEKSWAGAQGGSSELCTDVSYDGELLGTTTAQGTKWHLVNSFVHTHPPKKKNPKHVEGLMTTQG